VLLGRGSLLISAGYRRADLSQLREIKLSGFTLDPQRMRQNQSSSSHVDKIELPADRFSL
jgi:hypothetical protein